MSATMQNIADRLGVSLMTVSLALNEKGHLSPATRRRVLEAAQELGYRRNAAARATATGRFDAAALLLDADLARSHMPPELLYGIQQALEERRMHLSIAHMSDEQLTSDDHLPKILRSVMADGLLINYKLKVPTELTDLINRHKIPAIWIESNRPTDCIYHDNTEAARLATQYLIDLGHRRIAFVDHHSSKPVVEGPSETHFSLTDRRAGFTRVMRDAGLEPRLINRGSLPLDTSDRFESAQSWLGEPASTRPTAIVAYVGATAMPVTWAAMTMGMSVPGDLSVVTFADGKTDLNHYPFTRVLLDVYEQGRAAVQMLMEKIENPKAGVTTIRVQPRLVEGRTSAPPR